MTPEEEYREELENLRKLQRMLREKEKMRWHPELSYAEIKKMISMSLARCDELFHKWYLPEEGEAK